MHAEVRRLVEGGALTLALASIAYAAVALTRVRAFARRPPERTRSEPSITVLKPLHGAEPLLAEKLRSFCDQDYPTYEVVFGARDPDDPALAIARRVAVDVRDRARVVAGNGPRFANPKVDTLATMIEDATHEIVVIADSDMRVDRTYLRAVLAPFDDPRVGAVTCLYRGEPVGGLAAALGAMGINEHFAPSVLVAQALGPLRFCFGSTMAVRRSVFEAIGGLAALGSHLADDAVLGELVSDRGLRVVLSSYVVENVVAERTLRELWLHELRWARTHRTLRPAGYAFLFLTYPLPIALVHLALARRRGPALVLCAAAATLRYAIAAAAQRALRVRAPAPAWLVPVRDAFGLAVWAAAFMSRDVRWAQDAFTVRRDGRAIRRGR